MLIVTSSRHFADIDALACAYAYAELLNLQGFTARAVITAPFNQSISPSVCEWGWAVTRSYKRQPVDKYIIVDVSDPDSLELFVDYAHIVEVIDHHPGFEHSWKGVKKPDSTSRSCCYPYL